MKITKIFTFAALFLTLLLASCTKENPTSLRGTKWEGKLKSGIDTATVGVEFTDATHMKTYVIINGIEEVQEAYYKYEDPKVYFYSSDPTEEELYAKVSGDKMTVYTNVGEKEVLKRVY